jgi:hypothetical protein
MKLWKKVSWLKRRLQQGLFPHLEECWERPLTEKEEKLVTILELVEVERHIHKTSVNQWLGRKILEREAIARAFVTKAVYNHPFTRSTIEQLKTSPNVRRICGFDQVSDIPSEATFSRAFEEFANVGLGERVHQALVDRYLKPELVGHIARDATAIKGREKAAKKPAKEKPTTRKKGRPAKGEVREPKEIKRLERQREQSAEVALQELPLYCDRGTKRNSKGFKETWIGYKFHADTNDCGLPVSTALTAASVHDSQVAIPLMKMTSSRVDYLYDVMDAAYDAGTIYEVSRSLGHVPLIDKNARGKEVIPMAPHEAKRYNERTAAERFNSRLKEEFGGRQVMVRGGRKVYLHLMFGVLALFADQLLKLAS